jgi:hypothetical protein
MAVEMPKFYPYITEWLKSIQKTQTWLAESLPENLKNVGNWATGRSRIPEKHRARLEELGFRWPYQAVNTDGDLDAINRSEIFFAEFVREAWLAVGPSARETGEDFWSLDQGAFGLLLGTTAEGFFRGEASSEEAKARLRARAREFLLGLRTAAQ